MLLVASQHNTCERERLIQRSLRCDSHLATPLIGSLRVVVGKIILRDIKGAM